jgi:hypothetical protein
MFLVSVLAKGQVVYTVRFKHNNYVVKVRFSYLQTSTFLLERHLLRQTDSEIDNDSDDSHQHLVLLVQTVSMLPYMSEHPLSLEEERKLGHEKTACQHN